MKKFKPIVLCALILSFLSTIGCSSYIDFENGLRGGNNNEDVGVTEEVIDITEEYEIYKIGDKVLFKLEYSADPDDDESMEYTIDDVKTYDSLEGLNINKDNMLASAEELLDENGELKTGYKLILADVTIKNIDMNSMSDNENEMNISSLGLIYQVKKDADDEERNKAVSFYSQILYFSDPAANNRYYNYILPKGETKSVKVGWIINSEEFDFSKIYACIGGGDVSSQFRKFIVLNLQS
ncbi:MAG: hypothetical protein LBM93_01220 [Oscillospiraceae bacterium]|jgi:hypothetical protein|nr:hypothetical protein [Oscillospiraceae bacterium]